MSNPSEPGSSEPEQSTPFFNIQRLYLKDLSFEQPNSPEIFLESETPLIDVEVNVDCDRLAQNIFEIVLTLTMMARIKEKVAFLIEAKQAGIFDIRNMPKERVEQLLGIACPTIIFPYLRANIADILTRAGFPPVHLTEINFQALYEQRVAQAAQSSQRDGADANGAEKSDTGIRIRT